MGKKLFEIKSVKGAIICKIFELIQSYITEINIKINKTGLYISSYNPSKISITKIDLKAEKFMKFECNNECIISINTKIFYRTIKSITKRDVITLYVDSDNSDKLTIILSDPSGRSKEFKIPLLMIPSEFLENDNLNLLETYEHIINLPTMEFKRILKDFAILDTNSIEIKSFVTKNKDGSQSKQLIFSNRDGDAITSIKLLELTTEQKNKVIDVLQGEDLKCTSYKKSNDSIVQGFFNLRQLKILIKATSFCEYMNIYLKNDNPIILEYFPADLGSFKYFLGNESLNKETN